MSAAFFSSVGPTPAARRTRSVSICSRVGASTKPGMRSMASRILSTCSPLISPAGLGGRGGRQHRRQRFTGQRASRPQVGGFGEAAVGVGRGDAPPDPQDVLPGFGAQLLGRGLGLQPGQRAVPLRRAADRSGFRVRRGRSSSSRWVSMSEVTGGQRLVRGAQCRHRYLNRSRQHDFEHTFDHRQVRTALLQLKPKRCKGIGPCIVGSGGVSNDSRAVSKQILSLTAA